MEEILICTQDTQTLHLMSAVLKIMAAQLGPERWYRYNSTITTIKDAIIKTDPKNQLIAYRVGAFI